MGRGIRAISRLAEAISPPARKKVIENRRSAPTLRSGGIFSAAGLKVRAALVCVQDCPVLTRAPHGRLTGPLRLRHRMCPQLSLASHRCCQHPKPATPKPGTVYPDAVSSACILTQPKLGRFSHLVAAKTISRFRKRVLTYCCRFWVSAEFGSGQGFEEIGNRDVFASI